MKTRVLVIGKSGINGATKSVEWIQCKNNIPILGDYDLIFICMESLTDGVVGALGANFYDNFRLKLLDAVINHSQVYCITARLFMVNGQPNYNLFPFTLQYLSGEGEAFSITANDGYSKHIKSWDYSFANLLLNSYTGDNDLIWRLYPVITTRHNKLVAFNVVLMDTIIDRQVGRVLFVPPQSGKNDTESLENLMDEMLNDKVSMEYPPYIDIVRIPGEDEIDSKIDLAKQNLENVKKSLSEFEQDKQELKKRKGILGFKGKPLEESVSLVFADMGLTLTGIEVFEEDGMFESGSNKIPVEIKGHDKAAKQDDLRQVIMREHKAVIENKSIPKGILIVNSFVTLPVEQRLDTFASNIESEAQKWDICLVDTRELWKFYIHFLETGENKLTSALLSGIGILTFK